MIPDDTKSQRAAYLRELAYKLRAEAETCERAARGLEEAADALAPDRRSAPRPATPAEPRCSLVVSRMPSLCSLPIGHLGACEARVRLRELDDTPQRPEERCQGLYTIGKGLQEWQSQCEGLRGHSGPHSGSARPPRTPCAEALPTGAVCGWPKGHTGHCGFRTCGDWFEDEGDEPGRGPIHVCLMSWGHTGAHRNAVAQGKPPAGKA